MIPSNVDPRRPEKVERFKQPQVNGNPPSEDLTPDYMNILGPDSATANADGALVDKQTNIESSVITRRSSEDGCSSQSQDMMMTSNSNGGTSSVIPTSPQYGVAIISSDSGVETINTNIATDTIAAETTVLMAATATAATKSDIVGIGGGVVALDGKDIIMHSTPSRNDRFKVVKIASLEPFRRGRWKCMDYVDENPPPTSTTNTQSKTSTANLQMNATNTNNSVYTMQTQSLPQQHFQQMLVQGAFSNPPPHFYQNVPPGQMGTMQSTQYFYPAQNVSNMQSLPPLQQQQQQQQTNLGPQFISTNPQFFQPQPQPTSNVTNVVANSAGQYGQYTNVQYVPSNLVPQQQQPSAFVPTSHAAIQNQNFQQSQTYAGQPSGPQGPQQPMVNGHAFPTNDPTNNPQQQQQQPVVQSASLPTQVAKNVILQSATIVPTNPQQIVNPSSYHQQQQQPPQQQSTTGNYPQSQSLVTQSLTHTGGQSVNQNMQSAPPPQSQQAPPQQTQTIIAPVVPVVSAPPSVNQLVNQTIQNQQNLQNQQNQQQNLQNQQHNQQNQLNQQQHLQNQHLQNQHLQNQQHSITFNPATMQQINPQNYAEYAVHPQFVTSVTNMQQVQLQQQQQQQQQHETNEGQGDGAEALSETGENVSGEDPAKANPVVNAIDNKIEQAMDLVKSHLMYTVREEVEVLKEKIVELMERIQQLETENTHLKQQLAKANSTTGTGNNSSNSNNVNVANPSQQQQQQQHNTQQQQQQQQQDTTTNQQQGASISSISQQQQQVPPPQLQQQPQQQQQQQQQ